jgi:hypothetical protein
MDAVRWSSLAALAVCASAAALQAQVPVLAPRIPVVCNGQRISNIVVLTQPPYTDKLPKSLDFVRRGMVKFHANTSDDVVRRFLLFGVGDACTELERSESERILRVQPFLVDADVRAYSDGEGGVELEVETRDEFSVVAGLLVSGVSPVLRGVTMGESNLAGQGIYSAVRWRDGGAYDDLYGARVVDHQFMGQRNIGRLFGERSIRGHEYGAEVLRPYYTDLQRLAWHAAYGSKRDYIRFAREDEANIGLAQQRDFGDIGAVFRIGEPGRLKLLGASLSHEQDDVASQPVIMDVTGFREDTLASAFPDIYRSARVTRVNALAGMRRLSFLRVEGFDALTGVQDMRKGVQTALTLGRSIGILNGRDRDLFVRYDVYAGGGSPRNFVGFETLTEARRDASTREWDGVITSGRMTWYLKPWRNQLTRTSFDWGGGWNVRVPYQLTFGDRDGGLIGYRNSRLGGAHRAVLRVEQRWLPTPRTTIGDLGVAFFADVGKLWSGDVPYATQTNVRGTVGVGVLAAVPRRSRRLWRLDFGMPVGGDPNATFEVRISSVDRTRIFWREPLDLNTARERAVPSSLFSWP